MMMGYMGMGVIGMLVQLLLIAGVIYLLVSFLKKDNQGSRNSAPDAETILRERYAKGEITQEEFEQMRDVLRK